MFTKQQNTELEDRVQGKQGEEGGWRERGRERDFKPQTNMHRANRLTDNPLEEISDVTDLLRVLCRAFIYLYI